MGALKWIGVALGWSLAGPVGAIIGLALGSIGEKVVSGSIQIEQGNTKNYEKYNRRNRKRDDDKRYRRTYKKPETKSGDFEVSLLILASIVIKADGVQDQRELDFVRNYFVKMYGKTKANEAFKLFKSIVKQKNISTRQVCLQIKQMMDHSSRLQLLHFLFGIAKADTMVTDDEEQQIKVISNYLGISSLDYNSIKSMFYNSVDNAYKILEIDKTATIDEIKKAYRKMAKKYHPDRVEHLGESHRKGAEEKFKHLQTAYDKLQNLRGF